MCGCRCPCGKGQQLCGEPPSVAAAGQDMPPAAPGGAMPRGPGLSTRDRGWRPGISSGPSRWRQSRPPTAWQLRHHWALRRDAAPPPAQGRLRGAARGSSAGCLTSDGRPAGRGCTAEIGGWGANEVPHGRTQLASMPLERHDIEAARARAASAHTTQRASSTMAAPRTWAPAPALAGRSPRHRRPSWRARCVKRRRQTRSGGTTERAATAQWTNQDIHYPKN